jgi:cell division protein FtsQ
MPNNKRKTGGRRRGAVMYTPVAALLVLFITIFGVSVFFRVTRVEVTGSVRYTADEIIAVSGVEPGDNIFLIDGDAAARRIRASKPYVETVRIERRIPDTAVIEITESVAFAVISENGDYWKVDARGRVLERTDFAGTAGLIRVSGITPVTPKEGEVLAVGEAFETQKGYLLDMLKAIDEAKIGAEVSNLDIANISAITFVYRGSVAVSFGSGDNAAFKIQEMLEALKGRPADFKGRIILTNEDQISVIEE